MHASSKNVCSFSIWKLKTWNGKEFRDESESQRWVDSGGILLKTDVFLKWKWVYFNHNSVAFAQNRNKQVKAKTFQGVSPQSQVCLCLCSRACLLRIWHFLGPKSGNAPSGVRRICSFRNGNMVQTVEAGNQLNCLVWGLLDKMHTSIDNKICFLVWKSKYVSLTNQSELNIFLFVNSPRNGRSDCIWTLDPENII